MKGNGGVIKSLDTCLRSYGSWMDHMSVTPPVTYFPPQLMRRGSFSNILVSDMVCQTQSNASRLVRCSIFSRTFSSLCHFPWKHHDPLVKFLYQAKSTIISWGWKIASFCQGWATASIVISLDWWNSNDWIACIWWEETSISLELSISFNELEGGMEPEF